MIKKKIYYIEDDESIGSAVSAYLNSKDFETLVIPTVSEAKKCLNSCLPSLCLVDWNLSDGTGESLCRWIRGRWPDLPVIFITVKNQVHEVVNGFNAGADDYITKPFELEILFSRICALMRRTKETGGFLSCGPVTIDTDTFRVWSGQEEIQLSAMEYQLLLVMMEHRNLTVTRQSLLEKIWDANGNYVNDNTLTVTMKRLREKLHNPACIKTMRSFGYRMGE